MNKIAIDVVLVPPDEIMDKIITLSNNFSESPFYLNKNDFLPHISLCMAVIEKEELDKVCDALSKIANTSDKLSLEINDIGRGEMSGLSWLKIEKTPLIQQLHERIIQQITPFSNEKANKDMFIGRVEDFVPGWVDNYFTKASFENFSPHITLGKGEVNKPIESFSFDVTRLVVCQLGNYCTCRKILFETKLGKE